MERKHFNKLTGAAIALFIAAGIVVIACAFVMLTKPKTDSRQDISTTLPVTVAESSSEPNDVDPTLWNLVLVNSEHPLPENYEVNVKSVGNGQAVDERCYDDLTEMLDDCKKAGLTPVICSSYRTQEKQQQLFDNQVAKWKNLGYSDSDAEFEAGRLVAVPGTSEHQVGLALDIVDVSYQLLEEQQEDTPVQKWLLANSWKYGFILRYPKDKTSVTGISYEPWHYRYVGRTAAKEIFDANICLEEYLEK